MRILQVLLILIALIAVAAGLVWFITYTTGVSPLTAPFYTNSPSKEPITDATADDSKPLLFGQPVTLGIGEQRASKALTITLESINDSRCKPGAVCIWQGELSPVFLINGTDSLQMGTETKLEAEYMGYKLSLASATETSATVIVTKAVVAQAACYVGGCSNELCTDSPKAVSTCIYSPAYACYKTATCERQTNGKCGWTQTSTLTECIANTQSDAQQVVLQPNQREASFLLQSIHTDYVTGVNYPEYPVATLEGYPVTLHIGETVSNGCTVTLTLSSTSGNSATFLESTDYDKPCPVCLTANTLIETPNGNIPVQNLQVGMPVFTRENGKKVSTVVVKVAKTAVPSPHYVSDIQLSDGRRVIVSPGHLGVSGLPLGELRAGEYYDGAKVISASMVPYEGAYTYDILPAGSTGSYYANGILIGSTLFTP